MFPSDLMSLENKIIDGLKPISQNAEQSKVEMLASNAAHLIRHKVSSQVTANEIYVPVVQLKNETWVAITVHQLMKQRVVIVSSKVATANDPIVGLTAIATDAVKVTMESFIPDEEVTGRLLTEANVAKANVRRI